MAKWENSHASLEFGDWLRTAPGQMLVEREIEVAGEAVTNLFGYHLALVGDGAFAPLLDASRTLSRTHVALDRPPTAIRKTTPDIAAPDIAPGRVNHVRGHAGALPFGSDCLDVLVLAHALEFSTDPHAVLREADRVLVADGHLVLSVFNPLGAFGLWRACLRHRGVAPWSGQFFSLTRIKDWLALLGFDVTGARPAVFCPPVHNPRLIEKGELLEPMGRRWAPYLGGTYTISAKKRLRTLTPIGPRWRRTRSARSVGIAEPASRTSRASAGDGVLRLVSVEGKRLDEPGLPLPSQPRSGPGS